MNRKDRHETGGKVAGFFAGVMTMLIVGVVVATIGVYSGWLSFSAGGDRSHISVDRDELKRDTDATMETGRKAAHGAGKALKRTGDAISDSTDDS